MPGQAAYTARVHLVTSLPAPGPGPGAAPRLGALARPAWGGQLDGAKPVCVRRRSDHRPCGRQAVEWPRGYGAEDPGACWSHLDEEEEREECLRVRQAYKDAFWALKELHWREAGHGRDEWCNDCP